MTKAVNKIKNRKQRDKDQEGKQNHKQLKKNDKTPIFTPTDPIKKSKWPLSKGWSIFAGFCLILTTAVTVYQPIKNYFTTPKEKYDEENFVEGDLKPSQVNPSSSDTQAFSLEENPPNFSANPVFDSLPVIRGILLKNLKGSVWITIGQTLAVFSVEQLLEGMKVQMSSSKNCVGSIMYLKLHGDRLYISAEFKDIQTEQHIGIIEYNHWRLYKPNLLNWKNDDTQLEVRDKQNNIVCSISNGSGGLEIAGYYINPLSISVLGNNPGKNIDTCFSKMDANWKQKALIQIATIKSIFPPNHP